MIFGYTVANDVTARDLQKTDGQWARAKGFDTFCPLGPWIEHRARRVRPAGDHGGERRAEAGRADLAVHLRHPGGAGLHHRRFTTLLPGDVVLTGTPAGVGPMLPGDEVSVSIEGLGTLTNKVIVRD